MPPGPSIWPRLKIKVIITTKISKIVICKIKFFLMTEIKSLAKN